MIKGPITSHLQFLIANPTKLKYTANKIISSSKWGYIIDNAGLVEFLS